MKTKERLEQIQQLIKVLERDLENIIELLSDKKFGIRVQIEYLKLAEQSFLGQLKRENND